jgi:hypothetical protein
MASIGSSTAERSAKNGLLTLARIAYARVAETAASTSFQAVSSNA